MSVEVSNLSGRQRERLLLGASLDVKLGIIGYSSGVIGALQPDTFRGVTILDMYRDSADDFFVTLAGTRDAGFFGSILFPNGVLLLETDATRTTPGGNTQWQWTTPTYMYSQFGVVGGTYLANELIWISE